MQDLADRVRIRDERVLSKKRYKLSEFDFDYRRRDGTWQRLNREVFDRRHAAAVLPIDRARGAVLLVGQFRLPAFLTGYRRPLIEVIAGSLDGDDPQTCARREAMEEAGVRIENPREVFHCFTSPGAVTERMHLFVADYSAASRTGDGGGLRHEGEDIEVMELPLDRALDMVEAGDICDAKTILLLQWARLNPSADL
ncbi:MAG TPA: NUDIX domain-containing protein [Rhizomicrobium sp.]|nr:NUDIX domain-containing protein [Rhizomicrobium sp.]